MEGQLENEYRNVCGIEDCEPVDTDEYVVWLEHKVQSLVQGKRTVHRDDLVVYAGKIWRVDWFDGATLGLSTNGNDHKEVHERSVRPLVSYFRTTSIEDMLP